MGQLSGELEHVRAQLAQPPGAHLVQRVRLLHLGDVGQDGQPRLGRAEVCRRQQTQIRTGRRAIQVEQVARDVGIAQRPSHECGKRQSAHREDRRWGIEQRFVGDDQLTRYEEITTRSRGSPRRR